MPRTAKPLTDVELRKLTRPGHYAAGGDAPGLLLQVTSSGAKSWVVRLTVGKRTNRAGREVQRRVDFGLGPYPLVGLKQAREDAREYRAKVLRGEDPRAERIAKRQALARPRLTFRAAAAEYIGSMRAGWKNAKHADQWTNTLETYAGPIIGSMPVADVDLAQVVAVLKPIWQTKTETASRVRGRIEAVLGWAKVHGHRTGDNPARWKDNLDKVFAAPKSVAPVEHHAALPIDRAPTFMADLRTRSGTRARALEFAVLTAMRVGRVVAARWSEIDLEAKTWTIPAELMKGLKGKGREHRVPLAPAAVALLQALPRESEWVFPGTKEGKHVTDAALSGLLDDMGYPVTVHGFRSTFRDWAAERTDYPREVAEMALAHTIKNAVEAAYRRGDLFDKRRSLMADWADFLSGS